MVYTDDGIYVGPDLEEIHQLKKELYVEGGFQIEDMGTLNEYLGVKVTHREEGTIMLAQPHMIQQILDDLSFQSSTSSKETPALSSIVMDRDLHLPPMNPDFDYPSIIGMLNFLEKSTRPELAFTVHQCARFSSNPHTSHAKPSG